MGAAWSDTNACSSATGLAPSLGEGLGQQLLHKNNVDGAVHEAGELLGQTFLAFGRNPESPVEGVRGISGDACQTWSHLLAAAVLSAFVDAEQVIRVLS